MAVLVLTVLGSASPVRAAQPTRIVLPPIAPPLLIPAGQGCAFDVVELRDDHDARIAVTLFDDGRMMTNAEATPTFVNLETGASLDHHSTYVSVQTLDLVASSVHVQISGTIFIWLRPGDEGPLGTVEHPGAVLSVTGHQAFVYDIAADRITSYESSGSVTDLCEQLAA